MKCLSGRAIKVKCLHKHQPIRSRDRHPHTAHFICMLPGGSIQLRDWLSCSCTLNPTVGHINKEKPSLWRLIQLVLLHVEYAGSFKTISTRVLYTQQASVEHVLQQFCFCWNANCASLLAFAALININAAIFKKRQQTGGRKWTVTKEKNKNRLLKFLNYYNITYKFILALLCGGRTDKPGFDHIAPPLSLCLRKQIKHWQTEIHPTQGKLSPFSDKKILNVL